jgi:hypothetical protein
LHAIFKQGIKPFKNMLLAKQQERIGHGCGSLGKVCFSLVAIFAGNGTVLKPSQTKGN